MQVQVAVSLFGSDSQKTHLLQNFILIHHAFLLNTVMIKVILFILCKYYSSNIIDDYSLFHVFWCCYTAQSRNRELWSMIPVIEIIRSDPTSCISMVHCTNLILIAGFFLFFFRVTVEPKSTQQPKVGSSCNYDFSPHSQAVISQAFSCPLRAVFCLCSCVLR